MPGPLPKPERRRRNKPVLGEWQPTVGIGWQHGPIPPAPDGMREASRDAWQQWMTSWWASHWDSQDLPVLRQIVALFDAAERGQASPTERALLGQQLDKFGLTPYGRLRLRWSAPKVEEVAPTSKPTKANYYADLRVVGE